MTGGTTQYISHEGANIVGTYTKVSPFGALLEGLSHQAPYIKIIWGHCHTISRYGVMTFPFDLI